MAPVGASLYRNFKVYQIFGANTNVGKTIFSTILCRAARRRRGSDEGVWYLKPVSTGPYNDSDTRHLQRYANNVTTQNFYQFGDPVSPHIAAQEPITDESLSQKIYYQIKANAQLGPGFMLVESAGGPLSPGPSGTMQADLYRSLRLPTIFIADYRLGGISTSISSFESLITRGYDVDGVAVFEDSTYQNHNYFQEYFQDQDVPLLHIPQPPTQLQSEQDDHYQMTKYYEDIENSSTLLSQVSGVSSFADRLQEKHDSRIERLEDLAKQAHKHIWYPFTQHRGLESTAINTIDSAHGDYFQTFKPQSKTDSNYLRSTVDGSSSWWTQGLGHANSALTMSAAYAAGRYGHVMFASGIHEPAMSLAEKILSMLGNHRLERVFYSDNGSTGTEVAVKMALKASCVRYGWNEGDNNIEILALKNSYHGDTLGAMDMSEPSVFNEKITWYKGRGHFFDCPKVVMREGKWIIEKPEEMREETGDNIMYPSLQSVFDGNRDLTDEAVAYKTYIQKTLERLTQTEKRRFGALVMEPVVLGAGGMILADPLFQRMLVSVIRESTLLFSSSTPQSSTPDDKKWSGLPVVADEVFTGLYRLGHASSSTSLLQLEPDISVHAKLLTGGLIPLATTLASSSIYDTFLSDSKADALLHGHSYTAHPIGCAVANTSLRILQESELSGKWDAFKEDWESLHAPLTSQITQKVREMTPSIAPGAEPLSTAAIPSSAPEIWSVWSAAFVSALSHATTKVDSVWALGSILCISLKDEQGSGYTSNAAKELQQALYDRVEEGWNIHSRVLGNVIYMMTSQVVSVEDVRLWEGRVRQAMGI